ncbi:MAG: flagellar biosynthetic protein FliO [Pirellulales bacterium]
MKLFRRSLLLSLAIAFATLTARGQNTPAPPDWQDGRGPSVYLNGASPQPSAPAVAQPQSGVPLANPQTSATANTRGATINDSRYTPSVEPNTFNPPPAPAAIPPRTENPIKPVAHTELAPGSADLNIRRLAPPSIKDDQNILQNGEAPAGHRRLTDFGLPTQSIATVATALAIVIGSFLLFAWALRRGGKNSRLSRSIVPADAVTVLGRVMLTPRQFADLMRVGNKLVLVAMTPTGPSTITEVTDAAEVDRIVGLCQQSRPLSTTKMFEQVFQQLSTEPTTNSFLGDEVVTAPLSAAATAYRSQRGPARA